MKKKIIIPILLVFTALLVWYFYPKNYHETFEGVFYQLGNSEIVEPITIELEGTIKNYLTGGKSFEGKIDFQTDEVTIFPEEWGEWQVSLHKGGSGSLFSETRYGKENFMNWYTAGWVHSNKGLDQFSIMLFERESAKVSGSWSGEDGFLITFPAKTREEALKVSDELFPSFSLEGDIFRVQENKK